MGPKRIAAVAAVAMLAGAAPSARAAVPDLETTSATQLEAMLNAGQLTSVELTQAYINRIAAVNRRGPALNAVRSLNPDALHEARVSDLARRTGTARPLEGLPVLLKDNIDVAGIPTTASSIVLEHSVPDKDAFIVQRLKAAGAVILGKVNLTEFAAWVSNNQSSGNGSLQRAGAQPVRHVGRPGRLLGRLGRRRGLRPGGADDRHRHRGLDHLARDPERRGRHPAVHRPVVAHRDRADLGVPGHAGSARADGLRRRAAAERRDRASTPRTRTPPTRARGHRLHRRAEDRPRCRARGSASSPRATPSTRPPATR